MAKRGNRFVRQGSPVSLFFTGTSDLPQQARLHNTRLLRGCGLALVLVAVLLVSYFTWSEGLAGLAGAGLGVALVAGFFGADLVALSRTKGSRAAVVAGVLISLYLGKLIAVLLILLMFRNTPGIDHPALIVSVIVGAVSAGMAGLVLWAKLRITYVSP